MEKATKKAWQAPKVTVVDFSQTLGGVGNANENNNGTAQFKKRTFDMGS